MASTSTSGTAFDSQGIDHDLSLLDLWTRTIHPDAALGRIPAELRIKIAENLTDNALIIFRQVCSKDSRDVFAIRFFTRVQRSMDNNSLEKLRNLTQVSDLAKRIHHLNLEADEGAPSVNTTQATDTSDTLPQAILLLTEVFKNLSELQAGKIIHQSGDLCGSTEGSGAEAICMALSKSGHVPETLHLEPECETEGGALSRINDGNMSRLCIVWAGISSLSLRAVFHGQQLTGTAQPAIGRLLSGATNLKSLTLDCREGTQAAGVCGVMTQTRLTSMTLHNLHLPGAALAGMVLTFKDSLEFLNLQDITFEENNCIATIEQIRDGAKLTSLEMKMVGYQVDGGLLMVMCDVEDSEYFTVKGDEAEVKAGMTDLVDMVHFKDLEELMYDRASELDEGDGHVVTYDDDDFGVDWSAEIGN